MSEPRLATSHDPLPVAEQDELFRGLPYGVNADNRKLWPFEMEAILRMRATIYFYRRLLIAVGVEKFDILLPDRVVKDMVVHLREGWE